MKLVCAFLLFVVFVYAEDNDIKIQLKVMADQIELLNTSHLADVSRLKKEMEELKQNVGSNRGRYEHEALRHSERSLNKLRVEMREMGENVDNSIVSKQLQVIRNEVRNALMTMSELSQMYRNQESRINQLQTDMGKLRHDGHRVLTAFKTKIAKLNTALTSKRKAEDHHNEVLKKPDVGNKHHPHRHTKTLRAQISRMSRTQQQLNDFQTTLQNQLIDVQEKVNHIFDPNLKHVSTKVKSMELENKVLRNQINNITERVSDFDKVHASILELREEIEGIENKADTTIPVFRKEISKLDVCFSQLNAQSSYLKEDQENLRQSVKAIAVSVSNAIDRAELDRLSVQRINESVAELQARSKQHYYRLNDHILKSENNNSRNEYEIVPLPQLMGEVKELQPVEHEYEDLVNQLPKDCSTIVGPAGAYLIHPSHTPQETWCSNGSTLLQRRVNGSIEFNRKFHDYVHGFGNAASEFWLGLESMYHLTNDNCSSMRIDMVDIYGGFWYAQYEHFSVGSGDGGYVLNVNGFQGNASDAFEYQNHMEFSTIDRDRDISNTHCAANYEGGWWFSHCQHVNINGKYTLGLTWFDSARNEWIAVATSEMRMYRRPGCA